MGPVCSSASSTPWEHTAPTPIWHWNLFKHSSKSLSNQVPIHSWVERVHVQVKGLAQGHSATLQQPRPEPKTSQSNVAGHSHCTTTPCMHMHTVTLGVVTASELVVFRFFYIPFNVGKAAPPQDTQFLMLQGKKEIFTMIWCTVFALVH